MKKPTRTAEIDELTAEMIHHRRSYDDAYGELLSNLAALLVLVHKNEEAPASCDLARTKNAVELALRIQELARYLSAQAFKQCSTAKRLAKRLNTKGAPKEPSEELDSPVF